MSLPSYTLTETPLSDVQIAEESLMVIRDLMRENRVLLGGINELQNILMAPGNVQKIELMEVIIKTLKTYS
jgi:hypothetical protein